MLLMTVGLTMIEQA